MFEVAHALAGAAAGSFAGGPVGAFVIGFISHGILDAVPHWDYGDVKSAVVDVAVTAAAVAAAATWSEQPALIWAGALGAVVPDVEVALKALGRWPWPRLYYPSHSGLTPHPAAPLPWGVATQLIAILVSAVVLAAYG